MAHEHEHEHDHGHDHEQPLVDHGHGHYHSHHGPVEPLNVEELDPANRSLADALRVSFRLLSVAMLALVAAFLLSGIFTVKAGERAVVFRFGRILEGKGDGGVLSPGLHFSWPFPIDQVLRVPTTEQSLEDDAFWYLDVGQATARSEGLAPGRDGALMTGDNGLVHVRWRVTYAVPEDSPEFVLNYVRNVADVEELIRTAVENASVKVAAGRTVDDIWRGSIEQFIGEVKTQAQAALDEMGVGVRLNNLTTPSRVPPLQTAQAFNSVLQAEAAARQAQDEARRTATATLNAAATNWQEIKAAIDAYDEALRKGLPDAQERYAAIGALIEDARTQGSAKQAIQAAVGYQTTVREQARRYANDYLTALPAYLRDPDFYVQMRWAQAEQSILGSERVLKDYVPPGMQYVLFVNRDPRMLEQLQELQLRQSREQLEQQRQQAERNR